MAPTVPFDHPRRIIGRWLIHAIIAGFLIPWMFIAAAVSMFPSRKGCACERTAGHCECGPRGGASR
jgi:hypothetical protein